MKNFMTAVISTYLIVFSHSLLADLVGSIEVVVEGLRNENGVVEVVLFNSEEGYPDKTERAYQLRKSTIENGRAVVVFESIPQGQYAIGAMHDEDDNGKLKVNFLGIPKEGTAASNNAKESFGPPDFDNARIELSTNKLEVSMKMQY